MNLELPINVIIKVHESGIKFTLIVI